MPAVRESLSAPMRQVLVGDLVLHRHQGSTLIRIYTTGTTEVRLSRDQIDEALDAVCAPIEPLAEAG